VSDVEEGWSESWGQFGDVEPHLFIYAEDSGVGLGYVGSIGGPGWVQVSKTVYPNMKLTYDDTWHTYGTELSTGGWWVYYDGEWIGYLSSSDWTRFPLQWLNRLSAGGEVASPESEEWTCTDMGHSGEYGTQSLAAEFEKVWYLANGSYTADSLSGVNSDPSYYDLGNWYEGDPGPRFRYGGPGWCAP
jgi:neprosin-like protein